MSKTKVLKKLAKKHRLRVVEFRMKKRKASDMLGFPFTDGTIIQWHEKAHKEALNRYQSQRKWNLAIDYVINDYLRDCGCSGFIPETPERFKGKSTSEIYDLLNKEMG